METSKKDEKNEAQTQRRANPATCPANSEFTAPFTPAVRLFPPFPGFRYGHGPLAVQ
jgi:hypothetical protein